MADPRPSHKGRCAMTREAQDDSYCSIQAGVAKLLQKMLKLYIETGGMVTVSSHPGLTNRMKVVLGHLFFILP